MLIRACSAARASPARSASFCARVPAWIVPSRSALVAHSIDCAANARAYGRAPGLSNLLLDEDIGRILRESQTAWRRTIAAAVRAGVPVPATSASLAYFDSYRAAELPQNLTQAQRDFFGAHTYERVDKPDAGFIHTDWAGLARTTD